MLKLSFALSLLLCSNLFAAVTIIPHESIIISGESCAEIQPHIDAIWEWSTSLRELTSKSQKPECFCGSNKCQSDVYDISPQYVRSHSAFKSYTYASAYNGPNCFNQALTATKTLDQIRFVHPTEMTYILNSSLCHQRTPEESLRPGDIIAIRNIAHPNFELHAATYINDELAFSKNGEDQKSPYAYDFDIFNIYSVTKEQCKRVYGTPQAGHPCFMRFYANYYSCRPFYKYVSDIMGKKIKVSSLVFSHYAPVTSLEREMAQITAEGTQLTRQQIVEKQSQLKAYAKELKDLQAQVASESNNHEFLGFMFHRINSMYHQLFKIAKALGHRNLFPEVKEDD